MPVTSPRPSRRFGPGEERVQGDPRVRAGPPYNLRGILGVTRFAPDRKSRLKGGCRQDCLPHKNGHFNFPFACSTSPIEIAVTLTCTCSVACTVTGAAFPSSNFNRSRLRRSL